VREEPTAFNDIVKPGRIWSKHAEARSKPTWVESDEPLLAQMLAKHYGCPIGRPAGWVETYTN
jgi:hypothetical protein